MIVTSTSVGDRDVDIEARCLRGIWSGLGVGIYFTIVWIGQSMM